MTNFKESFPNRVEGLHDLSKKIEGFCRENGISQKLEYKTNIVVEELLVCIINYSFRGKHYPDTDIGISVKRKKDETRIEIALVYSGGKFNPFDIIYRPPNPKKISLDDIEDLELGVHFLKMLTDSIFYGRRDGKNFLTVKIIEAADKKTIQSVSTELRVFDPPSRFQQTASVSSLAQYKRMYRESIRDPEGFWAEKAQELSWFKKWDKVLESDFAEGKHAWFLGGKINVTSNCLDRHLNTWRKNKAALIWEGDVPGRQITLTYQQLHREVCRFANLLRKMGIKKGDRVTLYLPMIVELSVAVLACARIGAVHSVVFGGFSAEALKDRIIDSESSLLICADGYMRAGKLIKSKENADQAAEELAFLRNILVVKNAGNAVKMKKGRDLWLDEEVNRPDISDCCEPEIMDSEDPLFILYTSGSTGKPKGVLHTTAGYLLYVNQTFKYVFDIKDEDVFWCTADIGWITGHSYILYGPLSNGATSLMFEGTPTYPDPGRFWEVVDKYKVNIFYTAPTALRSLMREGDGWVEKYSLDSLRLLGTVGEPINPEAWMWYYEVVGRKRCPIVDTWWQTETGGILIASLPGAVPAKPGSATLPFFGISPKIVKENMSRPAVNEGGWLVIEKPWPGLMRRVYGDDERFKKTYFSQFHGVYTAGDGARVDEDGYYWIMGRIDDVINISGHRLGTAEIESALVSHPCVAEAAVVGMPHEIKGQSIYAFISLKSGVEEKEGLKKELTNHVRKQIGAIASPEKIQFAPGLPKTRSGKIMRRILTKIAAGDLKDFGDTSTLTDPGVVKELIKSRA